MVVDVLHALEDTVGLDDEPGVQRLSGFALQEPRHAAPVTAAGPLAGVALIVQDTGGDHLIVVVGEVAGHIVAEILAEVVPPGGDQFDTAVGDLTLVDLHGIAADGCRPTHGLVLDQVEGALVVKVHRDGETVSEHVDIDTAVQGLGSFPSQLIVDGVGREPEGSEDLVGGDTVVGGFVPVGTAQRVGLVVPADGTEVTHAAPGSTELEEGDIIVLGEERLAGNLPRTGDGREVAVVMGIRQTAGIVTTIGGGHEVAVIEAVGDTADERNVAVHVEIVAVDILGGSELHELHLLGLIRKTDTVAAEAPLLLVVDGESAERTHGMLAERTVIGDGVLASPLEITGSAHAQPVTSLTLTNLRTTGAEGLGVAVVHVDGEQGG